MGKTQENPRAVAGNNDPHAARSNQPAAEARVEAAATADPNLVDETNDSSRRVSRHLVWSLTAGASSMVVHLAGLLALGLMMLPSPPKPAVQIVYSMPEIERPRDELTQRVEKDITPSVKLDTGHANNPAGRSGPQGAIGAAKQTLVQTPILDQRVSDRQTSMRIEVGAVKLLSMSGGQFAAPAPEAMMGSGFDIAKSYDDAMDRITQEILNKLAKGKVLVVWVMDQSESMNDDRDEIMARIERVYVELGLTTDDAKGAQSDALLTAVTSYGANVAIHTPKPTSKPSEIVAALKAVPNDPTGAEMMCNAVNVSVATYQKLVQQGGRQMMVVLVTDESGDPASNAAQLETTIQTCRSLRTPVYVLGREAVFGYPYAHMHWIDPATKIDFWLRIDRGPETPYAEQLQIDGIHRRFDAHPSGFGPYEQSRMARQTGGIFFLLPTPEANLWRRDERTYDPESMRPYLPDLSSRQDYAAERDKYPLRAMLWKVISDLNPYDAKGEVKADTPVQIRFWDWPTDREKFAAEANYNLKKAKTLLDYLAKAQAALESVQKHRAREASLRWRANFDVTYAQTIAYQARLHEYIAYIGAFIHTPKPIKNEFGQSRPTNSWDGHYVKRTLVNDPKVAAMREKSLMLYKKVMDEHPGTPWAARAEYEIKRGFGCDLHEDYEDPRRPQVKQPAI
jgi:hypothetical protein